MKIISSTLIFTTIIILSYIVNVNITSSIKDTKVKQLIKEQIINNCYQRLM